MKKHSVLLIITSGFLWNCLASDMDERLYSQQSDIFDMTKEQLDTDDGNVQQNNFLRNTTETEAAGNQNDIHKNISIEFSDIKKINEKSEDTSINNEYITKFAFISFQFQSNDIENKRFSKRELSEKIHALYLPNKTSEAIRKKLGRLSEEGKDKSIKIKDTAKFLDKHKDKVFIASKWSNEELCILLCAAKKLRDQRHSFE